MRYQTQLFEWAKKRQLGLDNLAMLTGYSVRHLRRLRDGDYPVTEAAVALLTFRLADMLGDELNGMFVPCVSQKKARTSQARDAAMLPNAPGEPPDARDAGAKACMPCVPIKEALA